jgi:hypothetical protein
MAQGQATIIRKWFEEKEEIDIVDYCVIVISKLRSLVSECENIFSKQVYKNQSAASLSHLFEESSDSSSSCLD